MHTLNRADTELVPILVKVQLLQTRLLGEPDAFATAWNWIDAFLRFEHNGPTYKCCARRWRRAVRCSC